MLNCIAEFLSIILHQSVLDELVELDLRVLKCVVHDCDQITVFSFLGNQLALLFFQGNVFLIALAQLGLLSLELLVQIVELLTFGLLLLVLNLVDLVLTVETLRKWLRNDSLTLICQ